MHPKTKLMIFAKAPTPGQVKTRLTQAYTSDQAATIHRQLVLHTLNTTSRVPITRELWCAPNINDPFFRSCARDFNLSLHNQWGHTLGDRMYNAFSAALDTCQTAILVGTDCPALNSEHYRLVINTLADNDAVFIPAEDGGYVLIALSQNHPALFSDIPWSNTTVMSETVTRLTQLAWRYTLLEPLWDVDRPEDVEKYRRMVDVDLPKPGQAKKMRHSH